jgi:hypothetical protein
MCNDTKQAPTQETTQAKPSKTTKPTRGRSREVTKSAKTKQSETYAEAWSTAFAKNRSLLHLDLSYNLIKEDDCRIMAEGLMKNHHILGLHFQGNDGQLDPNGFLKEGTKEVLFESNHRQILKTAKGGVVKDSRALSLQQNSNCWICEGWQQVHFIYTPGISDDRVSHDKYVPIKIHLEIDDYQPDLLLPMKDDPAVYEVYRRLPPGRHRYYFTVGGQVSVAKDHRTIINDGIAQFPKRSLLKVRKPEPETKQVK